MLTRSETTDAFPEFDCPHDKLEIRAQPITVIACLQILLILVGMIVLDDVHFDPRRKPPASTAQSPEIEDAGRPEGLISYWSILYSIER
jgi:hypothetical protein